MSNQQKLSSLATFFICEVSGEVIVKFCQELVFTGRYDLTERLFQQPVEFLTAVTRKLLIGWSHLMDHRKAERVTFQNDIRDFWSFGQSGTGN
jgi:hypothetical protein